MQQAGRRYPTMRFSSWSKVLATLMVCLAGGVTVWAQAGKTGPKYDKGQEIKFKGTVSEVRDGTAPNQLTAIVVKAGDKITLVQLAPADYLKEIDCWVKAGDQVEVTGAKVAAAQDEVLAREVVFGNNTMVLRDDKGTPIWEVWKPPKSE
jgi:hypothetical protein